MRAENLKLDNLLLDPNNYRLQESDNFAVTEENRFALPQVQEGTLERLQREALKDLIRSIKANGFLPIERIVVTPFSLDPSKYVVIEGNRRVAALKLIKREADGGAPIRADLVEIFDAVPCVVTEEEGEPFFKEALMGIRHVGGIKQWGGYQRAKLIADLRDIHGLDATNVADRLGLSVQEVNRRYRAFKVLQQMQEDETFGEYATPQTYPLFHEAVSLPTVRTWLGFNTATNTFDKDEEREQFYTLITPTPGGDAGEPKPPKLRSYEHVRDLRPVLANQEARDCLLDPSQSLIEAQTIARRDEISRMWKNEISQAVTALRKISAVEVQKFDESDVGLLKELLEANTDLLSIHAKLSG